MAQDLVKIEVKKAIDKIIQNQPIDNNRNILDADISDILMEMKENNPVFESIEINTEKNGKDFCLVHLAAQLGSLDSLRSLPTMELLKKTSNGYTTAIISTKYAQKNCLEYILDRANYLIDEQSEKKFFPLYLACQIGHLVIVDLLLRKGASMYLKNFEGYDSLAAALSFNKEEVVFLLLNRGYDTNENDCPYLNFATHKSTIKVVDTFLALGFDKDLIVVSSQGFATTPLSNAISGKNYQVANLLINAGCNIKLMLDGYTYAHFACRSGCLEILEKLHQMGLGLDDEGRDKLKPIEIAISLGHLDIVKFLVEGGHSDINNLSLLSSALIEKQEEIAYYFYNHPSYQKLISENLEYILANAAKGGNLYVIKDLISVKKVVPTFSAFYASMGCGDVEVAFVLLESGFNIHAEDDDKIFNVLHAAAEFDRADVIRYCLERGLKADSANAYKHTPLHVACQAGSVNAVQCLLEEYSRKEIDISKDIVAVRAAVCSGNPRIVEMLGITSSDIEPDEKGLNLFHFACSAKNSNVAMLNFLLGLKHSKAALNHTCEEGFKPIHFATNKKSYDMLGALLSNGAEYTDILEELKNTLNSHSDTLMANNPAQYHELKALFDFFNNFDSIKKLTTLYACINKLNAKAAEELAADQNAIVQFMPALPDEIISGEVRMMMEHFLQ